MRTKNVPFRATASVVAIALIFSGLIGCSRITTKSGEENFYDKYLASQSVLQKDMVSTEAWDTMNYETPQIVDN